MAPGILSRLGAILFAPRRLARRDLEAQDHKASDDLLAIAAVALLVNGATSVVRGVRALFAGRTSSAAHALFEVMRPAAPLAVAWIVTTAILWAFTARQARRAPAELGARVTSALVLVSLVIAPFVSLLDPGPLRYTVESLPWLATALVFGATLREAIDTAEDLPPIWHKLFGAGAALVVAIAASSLFVVGRAIEASSNEPAPKQVGSLAPALSAPLLDGGRIELATLKGKRVVLGFWATWCQPCMKELPSVEKAYRARGPAAPLFYAVNVDEPGPEREGAVRAVQKSLGLTVPIALDDGAAASAYSVQSIPTMVQIDTAGRMTQVIERPLDEPELIDMFEH